MSKEQARARSILLLAILIGLVVGVVVLFLWTIRIGNATVAIIPTLYLIPSDTATTSVTLAPTSTTLPTELPTELPTKPVVTNMATVPLPSHTAIPTQTTAAVMTATTMPTLSETPVSLAQMTPVATLYTPAPSVLSALVQVRVTSKEGTQARSGPGISYNVVSQIPANTVYFVRAYGKDYFGYTWYLVDLRDGSPGWILGPSTEVVSGANQVTQVALAQTIPPTTTLTPTMTLTPGNGLEAQLQAVPVFSGIGPKLNDIYQLGQQQGNRPDAFAKVGDCNTKSDAFLSPIDRGKYTLGRFAFLSKTITTFKGSFGRDSVAAEVGFNVASSQDSFWADPKVCKANESPIDCEYRITHPSISIIMFGANDILSFTPDDYRKYMARIIEKSMSDGIIPVLMTITWHDHGALYNKMLQFNMVNVSLSQQYQIPLINFWLASQYLPGHGVIADNAHLSTNYNGLDFTGDQALWGQTLRSLLALEMLDDIQQELRQ